MKMMKCTTIVFMLTALVLTACATSKHTGSLGIALLDKGYQLERVVADTALPGVNGAAIGSDGNLYVTHTGNGTITKVDLKTMQASLFVPPSGAVFIPDDIAADDKGNLYVTGTTPLVGEVYRVDRNGVRTVIADGMDAPNGIEYNPNNGRVFVTECFQGNRVFEVDPTGQKPWRLLIDKDVIPVPEGFGFDPDTNDLIIPDMATGKILRVHPDTGAISTIAEKFVTPIALTIGADKMIYMPELITGIVYKVSLDGKRREKLAQLPPGLDNVAITPEGRLFVTSYWNATIYEVSTDGSGQFKQLFPDGINQTLGVVVKKSGPVVADAIMLRTVVDGKYNATKLNVWASHGMPLTLSLADGPGDQVFWTDSIHGAIAIGDPIKGEFKPVAGGLNRPASVLMDSAAPQIFVAEYGAGQISTVSLKDGSKAVLTKDLEGPLAMAMVDGTLYVAESKVGRISAVNPKTGQKSVFLASGVGKPGAIAGDGQGNLLILDGAAQKLLRINPKTRAISIVAAHLPVEYATVGSYPVAEFPLSMDVDGAGNIYFNTSNRGLMRLKKSTK